MYNGLQMRGWTIHSGYSLPRFYDVWWSKASDTIVTAKSGRDVAMVFWGAAEHAVNVTFGADQAAVAGLRPKFMLRAVVDMMRNAPQRRVLLAMFYEPQTSDGGTGLAVKDQYRLALEVCGGLCATLSGLGGKVHDLTDGAVSSMAGRNRDESVQQLLTWLCGKW